MSRDDEHDGRPDQPDEDAPVTPAERARAEAFGRLVDGLLAGEPLPPAMDSDARALIETATVVVASSRPMELGEERTRRLVDSALEAAVLGRPRAGARPLTPVPVPEREEFSERSATDLRVRRRRRDRAARALPWVVASVAAVAAVVLFIVRPNEQPSEPGADEAEIASAPPAAEAPTEPVHTSRPADPLFGPIPRGEAGRARERIDLLFADRMAGYRDLQFRRALPEEEP
ncbi:MAG TPA: hypothetical protein VKZ63_11030 [Kofleriaceae bacterium]|nr:hypothetical protein [Kofleriaceae bacterium]